MTPLERWHRIVETQDAAALPAAIAADAVFRSPAVFKPQEGRDLVVAYLGAALQVLNHGFRYERQWTGGSSAVLEFRCEVDGREVHGVDLIEWDDEGLIRDFTVMIRPLSALHAVIENMARLLQG